jgi:hypothetical protein
MSITLPAFTPAQESLFLTLGGRALDSRLPNPFLGTPWLTRSSQRSATTSLDSPN